MTQKKMELKHQNRRNEIRRNWLLG